MRSKISVTLAQETLQALDEVAPGANRSRVIEEAVRDFLARRARDEREARDLERLTRAAAALNREMEDVLSYQVEP